MLARQDRLGIRTRPRGSPLMHQRWEDLLFLHWPMPSSLLRPLVPEPLALDTFHGTAWWSNADFFAQWQVKHELPPAPVETLEFFLTERYCLYAADSGRLYRGRVYHTPWLVRAAELQAFRSNLIAVEGLPEPEGSPVIHYGGDQDVEVWPLEELESASEAESPPQSRDGLWK
jgi:uncharacterized protein YqjF (DUF2071 family)